MTFFSLTGVCRPYRLGTHLFLDSCSHDRSWEYFAEAIRHPRAFIARSASSCGTWNDHGQTIFFGDQISLRYELISVTLPYFCT